MRPMTTVTAPSREARAAARVLHTVLHSPHGLVQKVVRDALQNGLTPCTWSEAIDFVERLDAALLAKEVEATR